MYFICVLDSSVNIQPGVKSNAINHTALIIGAVVGTVSILFVMGWLMYCYRHRDESEPLQQSSPSTPATQTDRYVRGTTPNQLLQQQQQPCKAVLQHKN